METRSKSSKMEKNNNKRKAKGSSHSQRKRIRFRKPSTSSLANEAAAENKTEAIPSTSGRNVSVDKIVSPKEMVQISLKFNRKESRRLARILNLSSEIIREIEARCSTDQYGDEDFTYEILEDWKRRSGNDATRIALRNALIDVGRKEVVDQVFPTLEPSTELKTTPTCYKEEASSTKDESVSVGDFYNIAGVPEQLESSPGETRLSCGKQQSTSMAIENGQVDGCVTQEEMNSISRKLRREQHRDLARELRVSDQQLDEIEVRCNTNRYGDGEIVHSILRTWKEKNGINATRMVLMNALITVKRRDIVDELFSDLRQSAVVKEMQKQYKGIQVKIEENQRQRCQRVQLPQVSWTERILPLEELYVNLELVKTIGEYEKSRGEPMRVEELFNPVDGKQPVRILVEGGPGYGKTTLCLKLLNDFGKMGDYICTKFKMIFLFQLRHCKENDSLEEMLKRECEAVGVNGDEGIRCIEAFENETLLLLDGFDEISEESKRKFIPLFHKDKYPSMFVVVTSRRGMFHVENKKAKELGGYFETVNEDVNAMEVWGKRVLIKGVTTDKIETFLRKYLAKDYEELKRKIDPIIEGEMKEVFECPLFLILLAMMFEDKNLENIDSKTTLYKEFFNFIVRRNLIREKKLSDDVEVDIFKESCEHFVVQPLDQFGRLSIKYLCESKLSFEEKVILENCKDEVIFKLGFLTKIPNMEGYKKKKFYQPIHKSFLEFVAAFAMWNLFKTDENEFKEEIKQLGEKGLKPTDDSLFYAFLGGFMNSRSHVLFHSLTRYRLWFNIESLCFTNILSEIQDIRSFFPSFQPILDSFIPSYYRIHEAKGLTREYFQSEIHSLILKHSSDRQLINLLSWDTSLSINLSQELYFNYLQLILSDEISTISSNEIKINIECKNIICYFSEYFVTNKWKDFVSLLNSIQSEKVHFCFIPQSNEINSLGLNLLHNELIKGRWKHKNIDRLRFHLNEFDDPRSISLLVDLVKKNRINDGVWLWIRETERRIEEKENNFLKTETEELFNSIIQSKTIQEFSIDNFDSKFSPNFHFSRFTNFHLKKLYFSGTLKLLNSNINAEKNYAIEEVQMTSVEEEKNLNWIQNFRGTKHLWCFIIYFNSLVKIEWPGLKVIEELTLFIDQPQSVHFLNSVSQLTNLHVLSLYVNFIKTIVSNSKQLFINLFSSLRLRICEFLLIQNLELFSFLTEVLMEGMKKKEEDENNSTIGLKEGKKVYLKELVIEFDKIEMELIQLKNSDGIQSIKTMLRNQHLKQCCFVDYNDYNILKSEDYEFLFPLKEKFKIFYGVDGMNPNSSLQSQLSYRWFAFNDIFCIEYINE